MNISLREAFKDTQRMIRENRKLGELTLQMQAGTQLYLAGYEAVNPTVKCEDPVVLPESVKFGVL